jgi:hypothetical protein
MEWMFGGFPVAVCSGFIVDFWWVCKGRGGASVAWARNGLRVCLIAWTGGLRGVTVWLGCDCGCVVVICVRIFGGGRWKRQWTKLGCGWVGLQGGFLVDSGGGLICGGSG